MTLIHAIRHAFDGCQAVIIFSARFLLALGPVMLLIRAAGRRQACQAWVGLHGSAALAWTAFLSALAYCVYCVTYLFMEGYSDHIEPTVVRIIQLFGAHRPLYHGVDAASRYSILYGPNTFIVPWVLTGWLGASMESLKLVSTAFSLSALGLTVLAIRRATPSPYGRACGLLYFCTYALVFRYVLVWVRGDPQLLFWSALGLWGGMRRDWPGIMILGVAIGASCNIKFHAFLYFIPVLAFLLPELSRRLWTVLAGTACAAAALPFACWRTVSLPNYLTWLRMASRHGIRLQELGQNLLCCCALMLPLALGCVVWLCARTESERRAFFERYRRSLIFVGLSGLPLFAVASKWGSGPHHFLPLAPAAAWIFARALSGKAPGGGPVWSAGNPWRLALSALAVLAGIQACVMLARRSPLWFTDPATRHAHAADIRTILDSHPGRTIEMGYGDDLDPGYEATYFRTELPLVPGFDLESGPIMDMQASGLPLPSRTLDAFRQGRVDLWLIPKGDAPFTMPNRFNGQPLFGRDLPAVFESAYAKIGQSRYYDLWAFKGKK